jgi:hypothetical protein
MCNNMCTYVYMCIYIHNKIDTSCQQSTSEFTTAINLFRITVGVVSHYSILVVEEGMLNRRPLGLGCKGC